MRPAREDGFTLVELLVSITILAIVVGALGQALFVGLKTTAATGATLLEAGDAQALSARLQADVKGADSLGTTGGPACAPSSQPPAPDSATRVLWTQSPTEVAAYFVYRLRADAAEGTTDRSELRRFRCVIAGGVPGPASGAGVVLARWPGLSTGLADSPQISCDGRAAECGAETQLQTAVTASASTLELNATSGFPTVGPEYTIFVDEEAMTVTGGFGMGTLTVARSSGSSHAANAAVAWKPGLVSITVPAGAVEGAQEFRLSVSRRSQLSERLP